MSYKDKYKEMLELAYFLAEIDNAILYPKLDADLMMEELIYLKAEFDKFRATEPTTISKEVYTEIEEIVKTKMNEWRMPIWFNYIASGLSVSDNKVKQVFEYYFDKEEYEKCDIINKAKKGNFDYILNKNESNDSK